MSGWPPSSQYGGAVQHYESTGPMLVNCLLNGNVASGARGAIHNANSSPFVISSTVVGNSAGLGGGLLGWAPSLATVANSIFWGNSDLSGAGEAAQITTVSASLSYSCVQNWTGAAGSTAVSGADPLFVDSDGPDNVPGNEDDDFRLRTGSPYIDAGDNTILPPDITDLDADGDTTEPISLDVAGYRRFEDAPLVPDTGWGQLHSLIGAHTSINPVLRRISTTMATSISRTWRTCRPVIWGRPFLRPTPRVRMPISTTTTTSIRMTSAFVSNATAAKAIRLIRTVRIDSPNPVVPVESRAFRLSMRSNDSTRRKPWFLSDRRNRKKFAAQ